jgi:hypothetical protein
MSDYSVAQNLHSTMTADGASYLPMSKDELRVELEIGRIENARATRIVADFRRAGLLLHPEPKSNISTVRIFRLDTDLGKFVEEALSPGGSEDDHRAFERGARRLESASPAEVLGGIRELFEEEGWVRPRKQAT